MENLPRLVVLVSGSGTNLQAILDACAGAGGGRGGVTPPVLTPPLPAAVVAVLSNKSDAYGLVRAARARVPTMIIAKTPDLDRRAYDALLAGYVASFRPDYVILAGWMRILTSDFLNRFPNRVINLHPALPGMFPGTHAIERAYAAWQTGEIDRTGVMVHLVPDEGVDSGPVLGTQEIAFQAGESLEVFEQRVHALEHELLVETLRKVIQGK